MASRRGPDLPYSVVAGVTPWAQRWVVASAKMAGATFAPEEPRIFDSFAEVLDDRPSFSAIVVNAPIGYVEKPGMGARTCEREARKLLGRRASAIHRSPTRAALEEDGAWAGDHLDAVSAMLLPRYREVAAQMSPFRQRVVYEGHPELSFFQLNGDTALRYSKKTESGRGERREILMSKIPGVSKILDAELESVPRKHLLDAAALLWTARRVFGHAARRLPSDAEWDSEGLRMEIVL